MPATKQNTSLVRNTASRLTLNKGKSTRRRKTTRRNTTATALKTNRKRTVRSRRYRRNSASSGHGLFAVILSAGFGALIINLFDAGINRLAPQTSAGYRTLAKGVIGGGLLMFGSKLPAFARSYAPTVGGAFIFATALDLIATYAMPKILSLTGVSQQAAPVVVASQPAKAATGEMGMVHQLSNGDTVEVWEQPNYGGYGAQSSGYAYA
jgi:hypothetical protein